MVKVLQVEVPEAVQPSDIPSHAASHRDDTLAQASGDSANNGAKTADLDEKKPPALDTSAHTVSTTIEDDSSNSLLDTSLRGGAVKICETNLSDLGQEVQYDDVKNWGTAASSVEADGRAEALDSFRRSDRHSTADEKSHLAQSRSHAAAWPGAWSVDASRRPNATAKQRQDENWLDTALLTPADQRRNTERESERVDPLLIKQHDSRRRNARGHANELAQLESGLVSPADPTFDEAESGLAATVSNRNDADLMYGEYNAGDDDVNIAIAFSVPDNDMFLPSALEYDPDAKNARQRKTPFLSRPRWACWTVLWLSIFVVVVAVAVTLGILYIPSEQSQVAAAAPDDVVSERSTIGIHESIALFLTSHGLCPFSGGICGTADPNPSVDPSNPYRQALDWIQNVDSKALTPHDNAKFHQRYLAAYLYFSTSVDQPWSNGCEPILLSSDSGPNSGDDTDEDNNCVFVLTDLHDTHLTLTIPSKRWLSSDDECNWGGVGCDGSGTISSLDFSGSNMTGTFPEGVVAFPYLQILCLANGLLTGPLPTIIGDMKHLLQLALDGNQFTGSVPEHWYESRSLQSVNVGDNQLTGTISDRFGHGADGRWKDLKNLRLHDNALVGSIPGSLFSDATSIAIVQLQHNQLTYGIPTPILVRHLEYLDLSRNQLTGGIPSGLGESDSVRYLNLYGNQLTGSIPSDLSSLSKLNELDLSYNQLTGTIEPLVNLTKLESLHIGYNEFSGTLSSRFGQMEQLAHFTASGNMLIGSVPSSICDLAQTKLLEELILDCAAELEDEFQVLEISCPEGCCTRCCNSEGINCRSFFMN